MAEPRRGVAEFLEGPGKTEELNQSGEGGRICKLGAPGEVYVQGRI